MKQSLTLLICIHCQSCTDDKGGWKWTKCLFKDNAGKWNSMDNYRPLTPTSILSKVLERILVTKCLFPLLIISLVLKALKEIVAKQWQPKFYCVYVFYWGIQGLRQNEKWFLKLLLEVFQVKYIFSGMPVRQCKLNGTMLLFHVSNEVFFFLFSSMCIWTSNQINVCSRPSCWKLFINHLMYAESLIVFSPYGAGLQLLWIWNEV